MVSPASASVAVTVTTAVVSSLTEGEVLLVNTGDSSLRSTTVTVSVWSVVLLALSVARTLTE